MSREIRATWATSKAKGDVRKARLEGDTIFTKEGTQYMKKPDVWSQKQWDQMAPIYLQNLIASDAQEIETAQPFGGMSGEDDIPF